MCGWLKDVFLGKPSVPNRFEELRRKVREADRLSEVVELVCSREVNSVAVQFSGESTKRSINWWFAGPYHEHDEWDDKTEKNFLEFIRLMEDKKLVTRIETVMTDLAVDYAPLQTERLPIQDVSGCCPVHDLPTDANPFRDFERSLRSELERIGLYVIFQVVIN